jgi:hypothetical protein
VLATGAIERGSLAITRDGRSVFWKQDGAAHTAPLI